LDYERQVRSITVITSRGFETGRRESVEDEMDRFFHKIANALGEVLDHELQHQSPKPMNKSTGRLKCERKENLLEQR
jgi:hypothetical protein